MSQSVNRRLLLGSAAVAATALALGNKPAGAAEPAPGSVKIIGLVGSLRKGKTCAKAMEIALESAKGVSPAIVTEIIELSGLNLDPYIAVGGKSSDKNDDWPALREKLAAPDVHGILIASPVYMGVVSSPIKCVMERCSDFRKAGFPLRNKAGGAIAVGAGRNAGVELILQQIVMFMLSQDLVVVGDGKPTSHWGGTAWSQKDDISADEVGLATVKGVGRRVAETALRLAATATPAK